MYNVHVGGDCYKIFKDGPLNIMSRTRFPCLTYLLPAKINDEYHKKAHKGSIELDASLISPLSLLPPSLSPLITNTNHTKQ